MAHAGNRDTSYFHSFDPTRTPVKIDVFNESIEGLSKNSTKEEILSTMKEHSYTNISTPPGFDSNAGTINLKFKREHDGKQSKITYDQSNTKAHSYTKIEYENYTKITAHSGAPNDLPKEALRAYHSPTWDQSPHANEIKAIIEHYCHPQTKDRSTVCLIATDKIDITISKVIKLAKTTKHGTLKIEAAHAGISKVLTINES